MITLQEAIEYMQSLHGYLDAETESDDYVMPDDAISMAYDVREFLESLA